MCMYMCFWHSLHALISMFVLIQGHTCFTVLETCTALHRFLSPALPSLFVIHTLCNTTEGNYWLGASNSFQRIALSRVPQWKIHQDNSLIAAYPPTRSLQSEMNCLVTYSNAAPGKMFDYFFPLLSEKSFSGGFFFFFFYMHITCEGFLV